MVNAVHADLSSTPPLFGIFPTAEIGDGCHREVTLTLPLVVFILPKALLDWKMAVESGGRTNGAGCWGITGVFKSEFGKEMSDTHVPLMVLLSGVGDLPERHRVSSPCPLCLLSWWFNTLCLSPQHIKPWCCHHSLKCSVAPAGVIRGEKCGCKSLCGAGKEQPAHGSPGRQLLSSLVCVDSSFPR